MCVIRSENNHNPGREIFVTLVNRVIARKIHLTKEERKKALIFHVKTRIWWALAYNMFANAESLKSSSLGRRMYISNSSHLPGFTDSTTCEQRASRRDWFAAGRGKGGMILFPPNMRILCYPFDSCIRGTFQFPSVSITPRGLTIRCRFVARYPEEKSSPSSFHRRHL